MELRQIAALMCNQLHLSPVELDAMSLQDFRYWWGALQDFLELMRAATREAVKEATEGS